MKPIVKWTGGKRDELETVRPYFPKSFGTIVEPFAGGIPLILAHPEKKSVISDTHSDLINLYQQVAKGNAGEIARRMSECEFTEEEYYLIRGLECPSDVDRAFQFYYLRKTCYRGMLRYNSKGHFNVPWGRYAKVTWGDISNDKYETLLKSADIHCCDFGAIFDTHGSDPDCFMFLDPPYDTPFASYGPSGSFTREDHIRLFNRFREAKAQCMVVISETPFIRELYHGYIVYEYDKKYRFRLHSNRVNENNIDKKHLVIINYDI
jgi:DNA adenine methylase